MGADWPKRYEKWISGDNNWGPTSCYFNSALSHEGVTPGTNATLTIYLRVHLVERNAKDADKIRSTKPRDRDTVRDWAPGEFRAFKDAVKSKADAFWNKRFTLLNNRYDISTFDVKAGSDIVRPNVDCCFELILSDPSSAHQIVNCFCPNTGKDFDNFVEGSNEGKGTGQFSHKIVDMINRPTPLHVTCERDVGDPLKPLEMKREKYSCPQMVDHLGVAHEVGHLLGLPHVGIARRSHQCLQKMAADPAEGGNSTMCYVGRNAMDASNIMGMGKELHEFNVMPWAIRMFKHTGIGPASWGLAIDEKKLPQVIRAAA